MSAPANIFTGTGRRKTSTARVRLAEGTGKLIVNGRAFDSYFSHENFAKQAYAPAADGGPQGQDRRDGQRRRAAASPARRARLRTESPARSRR